MPVSTFQEGASLRLLIADDSRATADSTAELVGMSLACEIEVAYDGLAALDRALALRPDAVLLDLQMPGLDGLEVARQVRAHYGADAPYLIALTGRADAVRDLPAIDNHFDRVLAKPLDVDQLITTLSRLAARSSPFERVTQRFDLAELFTRVVRQVVPMMVARRLALSFDYRGPSVIVEDDPVEVQCGLHRLLLGLLDIMASGFAMFSAKATLDAEGRCGVVVEAAGSGALRPRPQIDAVLHRLHLVETDDPQGRGAGVRHAAGICPNTGAPVTCSCDAHEGVLLRSHLSYTGAVEQPATQIDPVRGARAWLVDESAMPSAWVQRRLQRLGWTVTRFPTCERALEHAQQGDLDSADEDADFRPPALLIVVEAAASTAACVQALQERMPPTTQRIFAVMAGSPTLGAPSSVPGYDLRVFPFSPLELAEFSALAAPSESGRSGNTVPAPLGMRDRPLVLLVDDNDVNRIVGRGLVEALGYEVRTAHDGLDAIDECRQTPPQVVLMDLDMPVLRGIDATVRLRELQRLGEVAPFAVIAATADASPEAQAACAAAGMDGFLTKPLDLRVLREQLRRFTAAGTL